MMKPRLLLIASVTALLLMNISPTSSQSDTTCKVVTLFNVWAVATPAGAPNGVIYGFLTNLSDESDTLISASTDAAEAAEIHQTMMGSGDVMQMSPMDAGIKVAAHDYAELKSGGLHIMLVNLKQPLVAGDSFNLTLKFEHSEEVQVSVPVVDATQSGDSMSDMAPDMTMEPAASSMGSMPVTKWPEGCAKVHVVGAWARPAVPGMPNSAAYVLFVNLTAADDTLLSASTATDATAEIHEMTMGSGDVMQMRPIEGGLVIPAGGAVILQPGGKHIMLFGLTQATASGSTIDLTLTFAHGGEFKLTVPIHDPPTNPMSMEATPEVSGG
jgi:periplasmic copper chaperone A